MKLLDVRCQICILLFLNPCGFTDNGCEICPVYVQKGGDAKFQFNESIPILSARFGGNEHDFDAKPIYMRVPENKKTPKGSNRFNDRAEFCGDLKTGKLCFILKNFDVDNDNKTLRIYYTTNNTDAPKCIDFIIKIQEAPQSTSESRSNHSTSTQAPSSTNITDVNRTTEFPTTQPPSNSAFDPVDTGNGFQWKVWGWGPIIAAVILVVVGGGVVMKRKFICLKIKKWRQTKRSKNGGEGSQELVLDSCEKNEPDEKEQKLDHNTKRIVLHRSNSIPLSVD